MVGRGKSFRLPRTTEFNGNEALVEMVDATGGFSWISLGYFLISLR